RAGRESQDRGALLARRGVDEGRWHEPQPCQRLEVAAQRDLVLGAALGVLEHEARDAAACDLAQVSDVERPRQAAAAEGASLPWHGPTLPRGARAALLHCQGDARGDEGVGRAVELTD